MKQTKITAFLVLAFILGVGAPIAGMTIANNVSAAEQTANSITVSDTAAFLSNVNNDAVTNITLGGNINLTAAAWIERTTPLTIDLQGYNITNSSDSTLVIEHGNVTITGTGIIFSGGSGSAINLVGSNTPASDYAVVTIGENVTLKSAAMYGIAIVDTGKDGKCYGVVVNLNGRIEAPYGITVNGRIRGTTNAPVININSSAVIDTTSADDSTPIYAAGVATWHVDAATLRGQSAVAMKAGTASFNGTDIVVDGGKTNPGIINNGIDGNNSVFQIEHNSVYAGNVTITVNGGSYVSKRGDVFYEYNLANTAQDAADLNINGGTFTAAADKAVFGGDTADMNIRITGGTFSGSDVAEFKEKGYLASNLELNADGTVVSVVRPGGSSSSSSSSRPTVSMLKSADGAVTVSGNLNGAVKLEVKLVERQIAAFSGYRTAFYDIRLLDANGKAVTLAEPVAVAIEVPTAIDGAKTRVYYIDAADAAKQLESYYTAGVINFNATHFSIYALVENGGNLIADDNQVPNTGTIASQGIINAIGTTLPLMVLAGVAFVWFNRHMVKVRRAERLIDEERARIAKAYIPKAQKEAPIDHFVATAVEHHNPTGPMVDSFIK